MLHEISYLVTQCLKLFQLSLQESPESPPLEVNYLDSKNLERLAHEHNRFSQWVVTAGALKEGTDSFEYRLRDASHIRLQSVNLVRRIRQLLQDLSTIKNGDTAPWDQLSSGEDSSCEEAFQEPPGSELVQIVLHITRLIEDLIDLNTATHNPAPHDVLMRAQFIGMPYSGPEDAAHLQDKYPTIDHALSKRLNKSISTRRRYFEYRQSLDSDYETLFANLSIEDKDAVLSFEQRKTSDSVDMNEGMNSTVEGAEPADADSNTSEITAIDGIIRIPSLPERARGGNAFKCPFCRVMIRVSSIADWREHMFNDVRPYICLETDCETPNQQFVQRQQWMDHLLQQHWKVYQCPSECGSNFSTFRPCYEHFYEQHHEQESPSEINELVRLYSSKLDIRSGVPCPLCQEPLTSVSRYQRHVGRHLEDIAFLPLLVPALDVAQHDAGTEERHNSRAIDKTDAASLDSLSDIGRFSNFESLSSPAETDNSTTFVSQSDNTSTQGGYVPKDSSSTRTRGYVPKRSSSTRGSPGVFKMWICYYCNYDNSFSSGEVCVCCEARFNSHCRTYDVSAPKGR